MYCVKCKKQTELCSSTDDGCMNKKPHCNKCETEYIPLYTPLIKQEYTPPSINYAHWETCTECAGWYHTECAECHTSGCYDEVACDELTPDDLVTSPPDIPWPFTTSKGCLACAFVNIIAPDTTIKHCNSIKGAMAANKTCLYFDYWENKGSPSWGNIIKHWNKYKASDTVTATSIHLSPTDTTITGSIKKKPWPYVAPHTGCLACAWGINVYGKHIPCFSALGPTGASEDCPLYENWVTYGSPGLDKFPYTDQIMDWQPIANLNTSSQSHLGAADEVNAGTTAGLEQCVDLTEQCANFYVLERLINDLFERQFDGITGRSYLSPFPVAYGSGLRKEMRAYAVLRRREPLVAWLATQLSIYLRVACGGELRHAMSGVLSINHKKKIVYAGNTPCTVTNKKHEHISSCVVFDSPRIYKYLREVEGGKSRTTGWIKWNALSKRNPGTWMADCADVFARGPWTGNIGGKPWAVGASLCADYERGNISPTSFIDRCWSLQHHGGCMFNKFYRDNRLFTKTGGSTRKLDGRNWGRLEYVLAVQANGNYDHLAEFATPDVRYMWQEHSEESARTIGRDSFIDNMAERSLAAWREREDKAYEANMAARKA